ncbi:hypothetical protein [Yoonia litorea]|uniref:hypothetical protein n=1 Tax=Yoonia litorea TaxID=1123755 RepID=UPI000B7E3689|nr:hypothetical protein [Yoonia litorea]
MASAFRPTLWRLEDPGTEADPKTVADRTFPVLCASSIQAAPEMAEMLACTQQTLKVKIHGVAIEMREDRPPWPSPA